jgi:hypothetical protein
MLRMGRKGEDEERRGHHALPLVGPGEDRSRRRFRRRVPRHPGRGSGDQRAAQVLQSGFRDGGEGADAAGLLPVALAADEPERPARILAPDLDPGAPLEREDLPGDPPQEDVEGVAGESLERKAMGQLPVVADRPRPGFRPGKVARLSVRGVRHAP